MIQDECIQGVVVIPSEYKAFVNLFVTWSDLNPLQLNVTKTRELWVDLKRIMAPVSVHGVNMDTVDNFKYLGARIQKKISAYLCVCVCVVYR